MQFGFVIDQDACIGCHACTVACKQENDVPVGSFRTWVKYTEVGAFPKVKRHFLVQRCNHCTDAPCVTICPVNALEKRGDGIVDLDRDACIGCRACMQACPYDSIYLNEDDGCAEKCHFCAHRVDQGLAPACVNVCPVNAIIPGDFDDAESAPGKLLASRETTRRREEQGTGPNVAYIGADEASMRPGMAERPSTYIWSDRPPHKPEAWPISLPVLPQARTVLDAGHRVEWGWHVSAYLVTKGIAAGAMMLAPFAGVLGLEGSAARYLPEVLAIVFLAITSWLLVDDLARPKLFFRLLTRPNPKSWLVKGGIILGAGGGLSALVLAAHLLGQDGAAQTIRYAEAVLGLAVAGYTAFLFGQCKGRDLWEGPLLLPHLIGQALLCGAVALLPFAPQSLGLVVLALVGAVSHLAITLAERFGRHHTDNARQAAAFLGTVRLGRVRAMPFALAIGVGVACGALAVVPAIAFIPALVGLYAWEHAYVRAGQLPPLS